MKRMNWRAALELLRFSSAGIAAPDTPGRSLYAEIVEGPKLLFRCTLFSRNEKTQAIYPVVFRVDQPAEGLSVHIVNLRARCERRTLPTFTCLRRTWFIIL